MFKIYVKPEFDVAEPILEEDEINRTNHTIEMKKEGFVNLFEPSIVDGKLGFFCNNCEGSKIGWAMV